MWNHIIKIALAYALAVLCGMLFVIFVVTFLVYSSTHARADETWERYNSANDPVLVEFDDPYEPLEFYISKASWKVLSRMQCQKAIEQYKASIWVLQQWTPEGEDVTEYFRENILQRAENVRRTCEAAEEAEEYAD